MPIWSLTLERLERLKLAIANKKAEHDELEAKSEKDLWCTDLDELQIEWDVQLALDAEIQTNIRRLGRRVSKKIGAGRARKPKAEDAYEPEKKARGKAKAAPVKVETKTAQRFAEMFSAKPKVKEEPKADVMELSDNFSDDDFAALGRGKAAAPKASRPKTESAPQPLPLDSQSEDDDEPVPARNRRAAASKAKAFFDDDSESNDDDFLGDVGAMVKGIGDKPAEESTGRVSLYAMNRPESSHGNASSGALPKLKSKPSKTFDSDGPDDTNYEMLAKSSPHKTVAKSDVIDDFLSDDDDVVPRAAVKASALKQQVLPGLSAVKKPRGRPAVGAAAKAKAKAKAEPKAKVKATAKTTALSPAAKRYAAKKAVQKTFDDDSEEDMADPEPVVAKPPVRRPGRAAAVRRPVVISDEESSAGEEDESEESDDPFEVDDDED